MTLGKNPCRGLNAASGDPRLSRLARVLQRIPKANSPIEQIDGDLLVVVIWGWFAAAGGHNRLSQSQTGVIETPGLSYGLLHTMAEPVYSWGVVRQVRFPSVNLDIRYIRNLT